MKKFRVKVKEKFLDGATGLYRKPGEIMTISEKRYLEIIRENGKFIEVVKDNAPEIKKGANEIKK